MEETKICKKCKEGKGLTEFYKMNKGFNLNKGFNPNCKECCRQMEKERRAGYRLKNGENGVTVKSKTCNVCSIEKDSGDFNISKNSFDGLSQLCKGCSNLTSKRYRGQYKEKNLKGITIESKICKDCLVEKSVEEFDKDISSVDGLNKKCKECRTVDSKIYSEKYKDEISERKKKFHQENREKILTKGKDYRESIALYNRFFDRLTPEEDPIEGENGELLCKCTYCGKYHLVKVGVVFERIKALTTSSGHENRIYCSDKCKQDCDIYNAKILPKSQRDKFKQARCNQQTNRKALLDLQFDQFGYTHCEVCGKPFHRRQLIIHHNIPVGDDISEADNMGHQIIVCRSHHAHNGCLGRQ